MEGLNLTLLAEIEERKRVEAEVAELQPRLMDSVDAERVRLALEPHGKPMQEIYGLMYTVAALDESYPIEEREQEVATIQAKLQGINEVLRVIIRKLCPGTLVPLGLEKAIRETV